MSQFNALEVLREAMDVEKEGIKFYHKAAKYALDEDTKSVFRRLADDELRHLEKLELIYDNLVENNEWLVEQDLLIEGKKRLEDLELFDEEIEHLEIDPVHALNYGIKIEEESIDFYKKAMDKCEIEAGGGVHVFKWLVETEKRHLKLLKGRLKKIS